MRTEELLQQILELFRSQVSHHELEMQELHKLLADSETRIKKTNEMVHELVSTISGIKDTYVRHIDQAVASRNEIIEQNRKLLDRISSADVAMRDERERFDRLMHDLMEISVGHGMAVNIKQ